MDPRRLPESLYDRAAGLSEYPLWILVFAVPSVFVSYALAIAVGVPYFLFTGADRAPLALNVAVLVASMLLPVLGLVSVLDRDALRPCLPLRWPALAVVLLVVPLAWFVDILLTATVTAPLVEFLELPESSFQRPDDVHPIVVALLVVVVGPITEEIQYRGLLMGFLLSRDVGPWRTVAISAVVFALIHAPAYDLGGAINRLASGTVYGYLRVRFDSVTVPVLAHVLNNGIAFLVIYELV